MRSRVGAVALLLSVMLQGCGEQWLDRYGPSPVLNAAVATQAADRQTAVVMAFARNTPSVPLGMLPSSADEWYQVVLTGFNAVDDACTAYIDDLWKIDRQKGRVKDILSATGAAVAAIVSLSHPNSDTLAILAAAFGLSSALTTAVADSYLYSQTPASIKGLVKKLADAYRKYLSNNYRSQFRSDGQAQAYYHIREYLSLCLPPTIQSQIDNVLANSRATVITNGSKAAAEVTLAPKAGK